MSAVRKKLGNMQTQMDLEMQRAISQLALDTLDLPKLRRLCATAEEWYDGSDSIMKLFSKGRGLPTGTHYSEMAYEVSMALKEVSVSSPQRQPLEELREFGRKMYNAEMSLRAIAKNTAALIEAGVIDEYITGVVTLAASHARHVRGKTTAQAKRLTT